MSTMDAGKIIAAAAREMARTDGNPATPRVLREYVDDARVALLAGLEEACRQGWTISELLAALAAPQPTKDRGEA